MEGAVPALGSDPARASLALNGKGIERWLCGKGAGEDGRGGLTVEEFLTDPGELADWVVLKG